MRVTLTAVLVTMSLLASIASAQSIPAAPAIPSTAALPAGAAPSSGLLGGLSSCCASCKAAFCNGPLGKLLGGATAPLSAMSGGLVPSTCGCCPPTAAPGPAGGAASGIQADQAGAKARAAAVRFLGTVDCHWYPEAESALIAALRADKVECVRFEAAKALARGCCCTKTTIEAMTICVSGSDKDGNPSENSLRVQLVALEGLQRCVASYRGEIDEKAQPRPEQPAGANSEVAQAAPVDDLPEMQLSAYYAKVKRASREEVLANAKQLVTKMQTQKVAAPDSVRVRRGNIYDIWKRSE